LCKLGSLIVHYEEYIDTGEMADLGAAQSIHEDPEVVEWLEAMGVYLPLKR
jgi:hypothetical protein